MPDPAILEAILLIIVLWVILDRGPAFIHAADDLGISLFRPWRGDPWPRGIQEDDDARFDWTPRSLTEGRALDFVVDVAAETDALVDSWTGPTPWIDDDAATGAAVTLERLDRVEVHRARQ